jgi:hypothetical protein
MTNKNRSLRRVWTAVVIAVAATAIGAVFGAAQNSRAAGTPPSEQSPPTISGTPQQGQTLTANPGTWSGTQPISFSYQWRRCDAVGGDCASISGATGRLYDLHAQDVGHTLRVHVTAKNSAGTASDTSAPTAVVTQAAPKPPPTGCPAGNGVINITQLTSPARLSIDSFTSNPSVLGRSVGTLTIRVHVSACGGRSVEGALVYAAAVPFNQFSVSEVQSGSDGWATITEQQLGSYPVSSRQQLLAVFLRGRKAGEPQGQGVSTSRLVSFKVVLR